VTAAQAQAEPTDRPVPLLAWYADGLAAQDPVHGLIPHTVVLVPEAHLPASTQMRATVRGVIDGDPVERTWSFTTGKREE